MHRWCSAVVLGLLGIATTVGAQTVSPVAVAGVVQDQTGAVLASASVELVAASGAVVQSITADGSGTFRFNNVPPGQYALRASFEGFKPASARVRVGARAPGAQKLVLGLADLVHEITVSNADAVTTEAPGNRDSIVLDDKALADLPVFDRDVVGAVTRFLDAGSIGAGGVSLVVDGMEARSVGVSASAIQQIRINQDPYAAEFARPGRGRIEIVTKAGTEDYRASADFMFRDARLNARDPFAVTRPPEQRRIVEGFLSHPRRQDDVLHADGRAKR